MRLLYTAGILFYRLVIFIASFFDRKAALWISGRQGIFRRLEAAFAHAGRKKNPVIWFHVSSLGEFEQGRPVIEAIRSKWPEKKILLTFFSPSGYEIRKNYAQADFIFYLPSDTIRNARRFLEIVRPEMAFFIRYDFWFNYMQALHQAEIPLFYISAMFRKEQHFFQWYGGWSRRHLRFVTGFFVQDEGSAALLREIGIDRVTIAGDTRFDRVKAIADQSAPIPLVEKFCEGKPVFIAGSSWEPDEAVFLPLVNKGEKQIKFIIAPHDVGVDRIADIRKRLQRPSLLFTELTEENAVTCDVLIVNTIGQLNKLYRYATVAFIGGGFGSGLHNIQEPVTFGVPVIFGPKYSKFREAIDLVALGGAFPVRDTEELAEILARMIHPFIRESEGVSAAESPWLIASRICRDYVDKNCGATEKILRRVAEVF